MITFAHVINSQTETMSKKKAFFIAAVAILVIAIIGITYLLFTEKQANRELVQEFQIR